MTKLEIVTAVLWLLAFAYAAFPGCRPIRALLPPSSATQAILEDIATKRGEARAKLRHMLSMENER